MASVRGFDLSRPGTVGRVGVIACTALLLGALAVRYPEALREAGGRADANAALGYADREIGGGNSVVVEQQMMYEARARIPPDGTFDVVVGEPREEWSELTAVGITPFAVSFLMPRRREPGAGWVLCYGCDRTAFPGFVAEWEGEGDLALLRRAT